LAGTGKPFTNGLHRRVYLSQRVQIGVAANCNVWWIAELVSLIGPPGLCL
jgi:hypothetical protein